MNKEMEKQLLQLAAMIGGIVPVSAGALGMIMGEGMLGGGMTYISLDSHIRYLSGLLFGIGLAFWSCIPRIETKMHLFRVLTGIVFIGGLARLAATIAIGVPSLSMQLAIVMELVITPLLCLWQSRIKSLYERG